jgi:thiamine-monophosphate kinase
MLIEAHLRPQPRVAAGRLALVHGVTAAMDLSDGLYGDLPKILTASGVDATIDPAAIPAAAAIRALFPDRWLELATRGGEDYELLLTVPIDRVDGLRAALEDLGQTLTVIGGIGKRSANPTLSARTAGGGSEPIESGAFDHFRHT